MFRVIVAGGHRLHIRKACHGDRADGGFGTASGDGIGLAALDDLIGISDGVGAGRAGGHGCFARALRAENFGDIPGPHIGDHHGDEERADTAQTALHHFSMLLFEGLDATDAAADEDADTGAIII